MEDKIDFWTILQDISAIFTWVIVPFFVLLQIIKGINYFDSLSIEWWMVIGLILVMLKSNALGLNELYRLEKYLKLLVKHFKKHQTQKPLSSQSKN